MRKTFPIVTAACMAVLFAAPSRAQDSLPQAIAKKQVTVLGEPLRGHAEGVITACFSPDGKQVLSGGDEGELRLWAAGTGKLVRRIAAHTKGVHFAAFYDSGSKIVSIGSDRTVAFFDAKDGKELGRVRDLPEGFAKGHEYGSWAVTADGGQLLIRYGGRKEKVLLRVDLAKRVMAEPLPLPGNAITRFALSPDGRVLAMAERGDLFETFLHVYDLTAQKTLARVEVTYPNAMCFSPDGSKLFVMDHKLWRVHDGRTGEQIATYDSLVDTPRGVASAPDGSRLFVGSSIEGVLVAVDLTEPKVLFRRPEFVTEVLAVALSPDQKSVVAGGYDGSLRFFEAATGKEKYPAKVLNTRVTAVALAADGARLVVGTHDHEVALWDTKSKKILSRHRQHEDHVIRVGFNGNGQPWSVGQDMKLELHDAATGKVTRTVDLGAEDENILGVVPSPDGALLIVSHYVQGDEDVSGKQLYWNLNTGTLERTVQTQKVFNAQSVSVDGKRMAVLQRDRMAFWSVGGTEPEFVFEPQESGYYGMALVGKEAAVTIDSDHRIVLWKNGQSKPTKTVEHGAGAFAMAMVVSPDGQRIVVAGGDAIVVFDPELEVVARTTAFDGFPVSASLSRDGKRLVTGMSDSTVLIWTLDTLGR